MHTEEKSNDFVVFIKCCVLVGLNAFKLYKD